jgi:UDP-N-acetylglucosamine--N-acetylmuramyl-(pentapeptide) pyrophosphoryl-undecaprenol N-acetylglucosamine transferase
MKVVLSGGGTLGSVSPLLAVAEELKRIDSSVEFLWLGTRNGPEKEPVREYNIPFKSIAAGKLRRYFSLENVLDLFKIKIGFFQSLFILKRFKPDVFVSAGAFVSLPAATAAFVLKIPILIHQQDVVPGLANKIISAMAKKITVSLDTSLNDFSRRKTELVGNPVRSFIFSGDKERVFQKFNLNRDLPILLVVGGGTGAMAINELVMKSLPELVKFCQIIHLTGKRKSVQSDLSGLSNYHPLEFATSEIADFYAAADLIISRAGMSSLSEICALGKPAIIIPIPKSHQEKNAEYFASRGAVKIFNQTDSPENLVNLIKELLFNQSEREGLSLNAKKIMPRDAGQKLAEIVQFVANK